jgi:hypothetical protein
MAVLGHVFESWPSSPSFAHANLAPWSGMQPPLTQTWPPAQLVALLHGGTQ